MGFLITCAITWFIHSTNREEDRLRFEYEVDGIANSVQFKMRQYEAFLIQTRAFFLSSTDISFEEFKRYFDKTRVLEQYPGIRGLGFSQKVDFKNIDELTRTIQKDQPNFKLWPKGKRDVYFPNVYFQPADTKNSIGFDVYSESTRANAIKKAWQSGLPAVTEELVLLESNRSEIERGMILLVPIYHINEPVHTIEQRLKSLRGFIFSPFETHKFFLNILQSNSQNLEIEVYSKENLLLSFNGQRDIKGRNDIHARRVIELAGKKFLLRFSPLKNFPFKSSLLIPTVVALFGGLITFLVYWIYWITRRQIVFSQLSEKKLQESVRSRDEFISMASHEFKTPLTSLKLQTQFFKKTLEKEKSNLVEKQQVITVTDKLDKHIGRLEKLVGNMLDISRFRSGKLSMNRESFVFSDLIKDVVNRMQEQFKTIPELKLSGDTLGSWDKQRIEQVIINLLSNAIKYGKEGAIHIELIGSRDSVELRVKDFGIGVSEENQEKIFDRFDRGSMESNEIGGLGLGLYISKEIVTTHKGSIWVESRLGEGSTFCVKLPKS
jgi:two-component system OmpR family sensor kinase